MSVRVHYHGQICIEILLHLAFRQLRDHVAEALLDKGRHIAFQILVHFLSLDEYLEQVLVEVCH